MKNIRMNNYHTTNFSPNDFATEMYWPPIPRFAMDIVLENEEYSLVGAQAIEGTPLQLRVFNPSLSEALEIQCDLNNVSIQLNIPEKSHSMIAFTLSEDYRIVLIDSQNNSLKLIIKAVQSIPNTCALLIGPKYPHEFKLDGVATDINVMSNFLKHTLCYKNIKILRENEANRENIMKEIENMTDNALKSNDGATFFYFSGHGDRIGTQQDDEGFLAADFTYRRRGSESWVGTSKVITGVDLKPHFEKIVNHKVSLFTVFDCCNSAYIYRNMPDGLLKTISLTEYELLGEIGYGWKPQSTDFFAHIAACSRYESAVQLTYPIQFNKRYVDAGVFTHSLITALRSAAINNPGIIDTLTTNAILAMTHNEMQHHKHCQSPLVHGNGSTLFGRPTSLQTAQRDLENKPIIQLREGKMITVNAGSLQLLVAGLYQVVDGKSDIKGLVELNDIQPFKSKGTIVEEDNTIQVGDLLKYTSVSETNLSAVPVYVEPCENTKTEVYWTALRESLASQTFFFQLAESGHRPTPVGDFIVLSLKQNLTSTDEFVWKSSLKVIGHGSDEEKVFPFLPDHPVGNEEKLTQNLINAIKSRNTLNIPSFGQKDQISGINVTIQKVKPALGDYVGDVLEEFTNASDSSKIITVKASSEDSIRNDWGDGDWLVLKVKNESTYTIWVQGFNLSADGERSCDWPLHKLNPGQEHKEGVFFIHKTAINIWQDLCGPNVREAYIFYAFVAEFNFQTLLSGPKIEIPQNIKNRSLGKKLNIEPEKVLFPGSSATILNRGSTKRRGMVDKFAVIQMWYELL